MVAIVKGQKHIALLPPGKHATMFEGISEEQRDVWVKKTVLPLKDPENLCLDLNKLSKSTDKDPNVLLMHQHPALCKTEGLLYSPIHEGEIVFFPAYWFHYIHNVEFSMSITTQTMNVNEILFTQK